MVSIYSFLLLKNAKKTSCWGCKSSKVIRWGFQNKKQRFKCKSCGLLFTRQNKAVSLNNRFSWFKKWITERQTLNNLSKRSGLTQRTLQTLFYQYLEKAPTFSVRPSNKAYLLIDGTYFTNDFCLILYKDNSIQYTQLYRFSDRERYEEMKEDLENLKKLGVSVASITCDGHKAILKAIKKVFRDVIVQRCIIHIQRMNLIWLTRYPKTQAGRDLRSIMLKLHTIDTHLKRDYWLVSLVKWHEQYNEFLKQQSINPETGRKWYKHKLVRRAFMVTMKALPNMFHYLDDPMIPKSTNGLESFFSHLKNNLNVHRGMTLKHRKNYIKWYLYFKSN